MFKIKTDQLEAILEKKIKRNTIVMGIDIATECGYCIATSNGSTVTLDYNYIRFPKDDNFLTYQEMANVFTKIIKKEQYVVIEDSFYSRNYKTFKLLSRFGGIVTGICEVKNVKGYTFKTPSHMRAQVGLKMGQAKKGEAKQFVRQWIIDNLDLDIENDNVADGIIIALYGLIDNEEAKKKVTSKLRKTPKPKKKTPRKVRAKSKSKVTRTQAKKSARKSKK